jgi:biotin carboxylase
MKKQKAFIHMGGGYMQLPGIKYAKQLGFYLVVTDRNPNAPGAIIADRYERIDGTDINSFVDLANELSMKFQIGGAYSSSDFGLPIVAILSKKYGFSGHSIDSVEISLKKSETINIWRKQGLPVPKGFEVRDWDGLVSAVGSLGFPVIVKPVDSCGSQGVRTVLNPLELPQAFDLAKANSSTILVERLIEGTHIDLNGIFIDKRFFPCGHFERIFSEHPYNNPVAGFQPSFLDTNQAAQAYELLEKSARAVNLTSGPVKADIIWTLKGPVILEIGPRFHGDVHTQITSPLATGKNPVTSWFSYLADQYWGGVNDVKKCAGWRALLPYRAGRIKKIEGIDMVRSHANVKEIWIRKKPGEMIESLGDNRSICGFIWTTGESRDSVTRKLNEAIRNIELIIESE